MKLSIIERPFDSAGRAPALRLLAYSFLILFFELALIRYLPANVKVFSFFLNLVLIATFVGMGAGMLATRHVSKLRWALPVVAVVLLAVTKWFSNVLVTVPPSGDEYLWAVYWDSSPTVTRIGMLPTVSLIFTLCALFFVPLGAMMGNEFRRFRPLHAYSIDIAGSLAGILCFGLVSYLGLPPWTWFAFAFAILVVASLQRIPYAATVAATAVVALVLVLQTAQSNEEWSPYYRINWYQRDSASYAINVNGSMHLTALDLTERGASSSLFVRASRSAYLTPYRWVAQVDTALVLGAGAGNDVALLLQMGAKHIDAVEIDPEIAEFGKELHFQRPYRDPRVRVHVDDARAFLRQPPHAYDVIVFGTLDSQTLLSGMSSVRLDNYVYTLESLRDAREALAPGGRLLMYHMSHLPQIAAKIFQSLSVVFNEPPRVFYWEPHALFNYAFVAGSWNGDEWREAAVPPALLEDVDLPYDDWPYLYLVRHTFPAHYLKGLAVVLAVSGLLVLASAGKELKGQADLEMFLLGLAFMLIETKSVTEMSLLFGSTWEVNLLVFSSILVMILIANWIVIKREEVELRPVLLGLLASLAVGYIVPVRALAGDSLTVEWVLGGILVAAPIFFAAMVFATLFKNRVASVRALGYNLFGAAVGGVLEYSVMLIGVKKLYLIAAVAYALVWFSTERGQAGAETRQPLAGEARLS